MGEGELGLVGTTRGDGKVDAARAGAYLGAEPEQLEANGLRRGIGELGVTQADAAQGIDEHVGQPRWLSAALPSRAGLPTRPQPGMACVARQNAHLCRANGQGGIMSTDPSALDIVGGSAVVGGNVAPGMDLVRLVRRGLPIGAVQFVLDSGCLTLAELDRIVLPRKTLANRRKLGTLTPEQSDRLVRVARVLAAAEETFGSREKAGTWLRRPTTALAGECPLELLDTDEGAREVETLLGRIAHGIAA